MTSSRSPRRRAGFSLVEVLAAISVLAILVLLVGRLFAQGSAVWTAGVQRTDTNTGAHAALDFMARELGAAVVQKTNLTMRAGSGVISFVSLNHIPEVRSGDRYRAAQQVRYALFPMAGVTGVQMLGRHVKEQFDANFQSYANPSWYNAFNTYNPAWAAPLLENVVNVSFTVYDSTPTAMANYDSASMAPPAYIEIAMETLSSDDARTASELTGTAKSDFIGRRKRTFARRVYLQHEAGYTLAP